jgi:hypothetical protein
MGYGREDERIRSSFVMSTSGLLQQERRVSCTLANHHRFITGEIKNRRWVGREWTAIENEIDVVFEFLDDLVRVVEDFPAVGRNARAQNGVAEFSYDGEGDLAVGDTHPNGLPFRNEDFRQLFHLCRREEKGIGTGDQMLHDLERSVTYPRVLADVCQIGTDETEWLIGSLTFDEMDPLDGVLVLNAAPQPIHCVGGIDDHSACGKNFPGFCDRPGLWVLSMDGDDHLVVTRTE